MSKYIPKKIPLTKEQVAAIPPEQIESVFGELKERLAKGQSTEGVEELLKKLAQHPEKIDLSKSYNLGGYSARYQYYKKLEQNRRWQKECPTDYNETPISSLLVDTEAPPAVNPCKKYTYSVDNILEKQNYLYWKNEFEANSKDYILFILWEALNGNQGCVSSLNELVANFSSAKAEIKELLKYRIFNILEAKFDKKAK